MGMGSAPVRGYVIQSSGNEYIGGTVKLRVQADIISYNDDDDWKEDEDE